MPELPEVETVRRTLGPAIGKRIVSVWGSRQKLRGMPVPAAAIKRFALGSEVTAIDRWGKYLLLRFADSDKILVNHLGMSGRLRVQPASDPRVNHTHLVIGLAAGLEVRYSDPRRFGHLSVTSEAKKNDHPPLAVLGVDGLSDTIDGQFVHSHAAGSGRMLKTFLLDQSVIAGLGNIYVSEALWVAKIRPTLRANKLSRPRAALLANAIHHVFELALTRGGTSLKGLCRCRRCSR